MKEKMTEACKKLFTGDITLKKRELWLIGGLCLFAGALYGIKKAPWTHGVTIGSHNGNNSGNTKACALDADGECCCPDDGCCMEDTQAGRAVYRED